jgi:hypothetical protein
MLPVVPVTDEENPMRWTAARFLTLALACSVACSESSRPLDSPVAPSSPPPSPHPYVVSGILFAAGDGGSRPLAGRTVWLWVEQETGPRSFSGSSQSAVTDSSGRYTLRVPESRVYVSGWERGERQPCLAAADVRSDTTLDVEIIPAGSAAPLTLAGPVVRGTVYETTPQGRNPLPNAAVELDASVDAYVGYTETDDAGRFLLCRVNRPVRMEVYRPGYQSASRPLPGTADMVIDIELRHE